MMRGEREVIGDQHQNHNIIGGDGDSLPAATSRKQPPRPPLPPQLEQQKQQKQQQQHQQEAPSHEVLLNTFQVKKKRYRVLLHCQTLVWERLNTPHADYGTSGSGTGDNGNATASPKETEYETDRIAQKVAYGDASHVVHINEIIRVDKSASKRPKIPPAEQPVYTISSDSTQQPLQCNQQQQQQPTTSRLASREQYLTIHYAERIIRSATNCNRWRIRTLTLYQADAYIVRQWHAQLESLLARSQRWRVRRMLVFINPYGGRKRGLQTYERCCKPLFQLAGIDASCIISQRANQIRDILLGHDLMLYDAVCCVGGDGTVAEVINGLLLRTMIDAGINTTQPNILPKPRIPIGVIPAGSTDTVAYSLHGTEDPLTAAIHIVLGQRRGLDVCSVRNSNGLVRFCASVFSYGYLGDVAAKSEQYRWMGTKRYEFTGARAFVLNRGYEAELRLLEDSDETDANNSVPSDNMTTCYASCQRCESATTMQDNSISDGINKHKNKNCDIRNSNSNNNPTNSLDAGNATTKQTTDSDDNTTTTSTTMLTNDQKDDNKEESWKVVRGKFFMISGANITCACSRSPNGISRYNHLGDGYLELILVRCTSLWNNVRLLLNTMGHSGDIRSLPFVEVYRTKRFSFRVPPTVRNGGDDYDSVRGSCQPIAENAVGLTAEVSDQRNNDFISSWNCDGEVVKDLDVMMSSHCQLIDVFMRGPFAYSKPLKGATMNTNQITKCCCCSSAED